MSRMNNYNVKTKTENIYKKHINLKVSFFCSFVF